jgi:sugar lactone lactonase YvrE
MVGAVVPRQAAAGFVAAVEAGFGVIIDGALQVVEATLPSPTIRMNDAKCDSRGRLWAGSTHLTFEANRGALHRWDGVQPSQVVLTGLTLPNGLGWSATDDRFYLVDSMDRVVWAFAYDADEGALSARRLLFELNGVLPDGLAVDEDGCVWVAQWGGSSVVRISPTGKLIGRVPMPVSQPSSCAWAADGTLVITSARSGLSEEQLQREPHAGSIFALSTPVSGAPIHDFAR